MGIHTVKKLFSWLNSELRYKTAGPIFVITLALFASAVIPLLVTIDGIVYIANAKSILTDDFAAVYTLYREPGFPLFLKGIHFFGDAGVLLVLTQSALMACAGLLAYFSVARLLGREQPRIWELSLLWIFLINPMFLGYSGAVLQQALFSFQLAVFSLFLSLALKPSPRSPRWLLAVLTIVWYLMGIATSIGWMYLALLPVTATLFLLYRTGLSQILDKVWKKKVFSQILVFLTIPLLLVVTYSIGRQTFQAWENFKLPYIAEQQDDGYVIKPLETVPYIPTPIEMTQRTMSLMNMIVIEPYEKENDLFMGIQMRRQSPSSSWDSAWEVEPQASYALNYFVITNPGEILHNGYARLASFAAIWYQASFVAMWLFALFLLIRRKWKAASILILAPINFLLVYAASNSPIDRYGIPAWTFAATSVFLLFTSIAGSKRKVDEA